MLKDISFENFAQDHKSNFIFKQKLRISVNFKLNVLLVKISLFKKISVETKSLLFKLCLSAFFVLYLHFIVLNYYIEIKETKYH